MCYFFKNFIQLEVYTTAYCTSYKQVKMAKVVRITIIYCIKYIFIIIIYNAKLYYVLKMIMTKKNLLK